MFRPVAPEVYLAATSSQEIHGYISVIVALSFTYFLIKGIFFFVKNHRETFKIGGVCFS